MMPQGRRTIDIDRLQAFLPLYKRIVAEHAEIKDLLNEPLEELRYDNVDPEWIRNSIYELQQLLRPRT